MGNEVKTEKYREIELLEFKENDVPVVCYDESVIGDCDETTIRNYLALHAEQYPEIKEHIDDGTHTPEGCMSYVTQQVRKSSEKRDGTVMVSSDKVFRLAVNYYMSPVVEKERKVVTHSPAPSAFSDWNSPEATARREAAERERKEQEAERKRQADIKKNGLSLFDF